MVIYGFVYISWRELGRDEVVFVLCLDSGMFTLIMKVDSEML